MDDMVRKGRQARGKEHGNVKLTVEQVIEIRASLKSLRQLAEDYAVSHVQISRIKRRKHWIHI